MASKGSVLMPGVPIKDIYQHKIWTTDLEAYNKLTTSPGSTPLVTTRLVVTYCNWIWQPSRFKTTAAQRAGLTERCWCWHDIAIYPTIIWCIIVYSSLIPNADHMISKTYMTRVKGENTRLRHYLARLHRKTLCYSKSEEMLRHSIRLLIHYLKFWNVPVPYRFISWFSNTRIFNGFAADFTQSIFEILEFLGNVKPVQNWFYGLASRF